MAKSKGQEKPTKIKPKSKTNKSLMPINFIIVTASIAVAIWFGYKGYLETRVNTPYDVKKACNLSNNDFIQDLALEINFGDIRYIICSRTLSVHKQSNIH